MAWWPQSPVLKDVHILPYIPPQALQRPSEEDIIPVPILQMRKLRHKVVKAMYPSHKASKETQDSNSVFLVPLCFPKSLSLGSVAPQSEP